MDPTHKEALKKCRTTIVRDLSPDAELWDLLVEKDVFTPMMMEYIQAEKTRSDKNRKLLDDIPRRGPKAYGLFLLCLRNSGHEHLADVILENERLIRRQNNPNTVSPVAPTSGHEGELLFSGSHSSRPLPGYNSNVNASSSVGPSQQSSTFQPRPQASSGISQPTTQEEEAMAVDMQDGPSQSAVGQSTSMPLSSSSLTTMSSTSGSLSQQQPSSIYEQQRNRNSDRVYKMESDPRGLLLIINNKIFARPHEDRSGTDIDCNELQNLYCTLGFRVEVLQNLTAQSMIHEMIRVSHYEDLHNMGCIVIALLSHGNQNESILGVDGSSVHFKEFMKIFTPTFCPALMNKPKMFILNACRGGEEDHGFHSINLDVSSRPETNSTAVGDYVCRDIEVLQPEESRQLVNRMPNMKDFLIAYSTFPGHVSWRNPDMGSWFIQAFCDVFRQESAENHVLDMLTMVNDKVAGYYDEDSDAMQIPAPTSTLSKKWFINPPAGN